MSESPEAQLEAAAELVVFAHDADGSGLPPGQGPAPALERVAALAATALAGAATPPARLQQRLAAAGLHFCAAQRAHRAPATQRPPLPAGSPVRRARRALALPFLAGLAAGVGMLLALQPRPGSPSPRDLRASVLTADARALRLPWKAGPSPLCGALAGEVVWSQSRQEGYLTFRGLPPLDAGHRFQLWIVDGDREGAPVDGGLFTVGDAATETVVPVQARLPIGKPAAFVVTVEDRVGAVVSKQEQVVAIAGP